MTDLERFIELYKSIGIELKPFEMIDTTKITMSNDHSDAFRASPNPNVATISPKFTGYGFSNLIFDMDGKFISQHFGQ